MKSERVQRSEFKIRLRREYGDTTMNLRVFLQNVDSYTAHMTKKQLCAFIHENGRILEESERNDYLDRLKIYSTYQASDVEVLEYEKDEDFKQGCEDLEAELSRISNEELCIEAALNYEYDDWYDDLDEEFIFSDAMGVTAIIENAADYVHRCVDNEEYAYGYEIADKLVGLEISINGDDWDSMYENLHVDDLNRYNLGNVDCKQLATDYLYLTYCVNDDMKKRAENLYRAITVLQYVDVTLEDILQEGKEVTDIEEFLPVWIAYLGQIVSIMAQKLLKEAMELQGDEIALLEYARQLVKIHPGLYEQYLNRIWDKENSDYIFDVGDEALDKIDDRYIVRSRIADRLCKLAVSHGKTMDADRYRLERFRSDSNLSNFISLYMSNSDFSSTENEVRKICNKAYKEYKRDQAFYTQKGELEENNQTLDTVCMLKFLQGDFQTIKNEVMNTNAPLGWSSTFMKCGMAAFLLVLKEGESLDKGCKAMCERIVRDLDVANDEYAIKNGESIETISVERFIVFFEKWKTHITLGDYEKENYMHWIEHLIGKRVAGIMEANRRNYYGECASYIAAYGEVAESQGISNAKQEEFVKYKKMYPRRRLFCQQLRVYGMRDGK